MPLTASTVAVDLAKFRIAGLPRPQYTIRQEWLLLAQSEMRPSAVCLRHCHASFSSVRGGLMTANTVRGADIGNFWFWLAVIRAYAMARTGSPMIELHWFAVRPDR